MRIAYFCEPQVGGTFTFFQRLRAELSPRGVDVRCIPPVSGEKFSGTRFEGAEGVDFVEFPEDLAAASRKLCEHVVSGGFDIAVTLPGCDILTTNLVRYLPASVRTMARVPMMTEGTYRPTRAIAPHLDGIVCVCDRIRDDLAAQDVPTEKLRVIYNGCDTSLFAPPPARDPAAPLRLIYAGRLEDVQKNVMALPCILERVRRELPDTTLNIVGHGPDGDRLRALVAELELADACKLSPAVPNAQLPALYGAADIMVMPTRFEGSSNALLEAMVCGCAPVVSLLRGSTDTVVENGVSGALCRVDDADDFAQRIVALGRDRAALATMQSAASRRARTDFSVARMADAYAAAFREVLASPVARAAPLDLSRYEIPAAMRPTWRRFIPKSVKTFLRARLERAGKSA